MSLNAATIENRGVHFRIFALMKKLNVDANPVNFELLHEILSGANPELRERFSKLGKNISQEQLNALGEEFLPHHFSDVLFEKSTSTVRFDLEDLIGSLGQSGKDLEDYSGQLSKSSERFRQIDPSDTKAIRAELNGLVAATDRQKEKGRDALNIINTKLESVRAVAAEVDSFQAAKFTHASTGLGNRRAFNKRIASLFSQGKLPGEYTLIFGNITRFEGLDRGDLLKVKEALLARIGNSISAITSEEDFGAWLDNPHFAILLETSSESEIKRLTGQVSGQIQSALKAIKAQAPFLQAMGVFFGASTTYAAGNAAALIQNSEKALAKAVEAAQPEVVIYGQTSSDAEAGKNYKLYDGVYM